LRKPKKTNDRDPNNPLNLGPGRQLALPVLLMLRRRMEQ
jgi:hypothetical protein